MASAAWGRIAHKLEATGRRVASLESDPERRNSFVPYTAERDTAYGGVLPDRIDGGWQEILDRNRTAGRRYNLLGDSIRDLAMRMGDPYYSVPTPAEAGTNVQGVSR